MNSARGWLLEVLNQEPTGAIYFNDLCHIHYVPNVFKFEFIVLFLKIFKIFVLGIFTTPSNRIEFKLLTAVLLQLGQVSIKGA